MEHPRYADGTPILLGDVVTTESHFGSFKDKGAVVGEIRYNQHMDEVWILLDLPFDRGSRAAVFYADMLEKL